MWKKTFTENVCGYQMNEMTLGFQGFFHTSLFGKLLTQGMTRLFISASWDLMKLDWVQAKA